MHARLTPIVPLPSVPLPQFFVVVGILTANLVNYGTGKMSTDGWRISLVGSLYPLLVSAIGQQLLSAGAWLAQGTLCLLICPPWALPATRSRPAQGVIGGPALLVACASPFLPDSPDSLIARQRPGDARKVLQASRQRVHWTQAAAAAAPASFCSTTQPPVTLPCARLPRVRSACAARRTWRRSGR